MYTKVFYFAGEGDPIPREELRTMIKEINRYSVPVAVQEWGIKENFELGSIYDYQFSPQEIKNPVMNSILRNGWAVRFGMW